LNAQQKHRAICCAGNCGPFFPGGFGISDSCNTNTRSAGFIFGLCYRNDTGLEGETFLTSSKDFRVKEIEVFEIAD
jgi:hypothetical protein